MTGEQDGDWGNKTVTGGTECGLGEQNGDWGNRTVTYDETDHLSGIVSDGSVNYLSGDAPHTPSFW